jgi:hypothetical protein
LSRGAGCRDVGEAIEAAADVSLISWAICLEIGKMERSHGRRLADHLQQVSVAKCGAFMVGQKEEERTYKAAPRSPAKGPAERTLAAAPQTGSVVKALSLQIQEPPVRAQVGCFLEGSTLTQRISSFVIAALYPAARKALLSISVGHRDNVRHAAEAQQ